MQAFLSKPVKCQDLIQAVRRVLGLGSSKSHQTEAKTRAADAKAVAAAAKAEGIGADSPSSLAASQVSIDSAILTAAGSTAQQALREAISTEKAASNADTKSGSDVWEINDKASDEGTETAGALQASGDSTTPSIQQAKAEAATAKDEREASVP